MCGDYVVCIKDSDPRYPWVENMIYNRKFEKYMDVTAWLNGDKGLNDLNIPKQQIILKHI